MNRRSFLTFLGLAPVAAATGAVAAVQPKPLAGYMSGVTLTGERGPEIVNLPRSSSIAPSSELKLSVDTSELVSEMRRIERKIDRQTINAVRRLRRLRAI